MENEEIVRRFIAAWSRLDPEELSSYFAEDGVYHNMPGAAVAGRENVKKLIASSHTWKRPTGNSSREAETLACMTEAMKSIASTREPGTT